MRSPILSLLILCVACEGALPTAPESETTSGARVGVLEEVEPLFRFEAPVRIPLGQAVTARILASWDYPLGVELYSSDPETATITGRIEPGSSFAIVQITGHATGSIEARAIVWNFGRSLGIHRVEGTIVIDPAAAKRRAVRH